MAPYSASLKVYIAFSDGPLVASPTWTDVSAYVRSVSTNRGRSNELDDFSTGTASVVLDNRTRRFDPDYTAGPYYGNIKVRRQVKIEATYSAVTYPIFRGLVQSWVQGYPGVGKDATCTIQCADLFSVLASWELPRDAYELVMRTMSPTVWYRLDDSGRSAVDKLSTANQLSYGADRTVADGIVPGAAGASQIAAVSGTNADPIASGSFTTALASSTSTSIAGVVRVGLGGSTAYLVHLWSSANVDSLAVNVTRGVFESRIVQDTPLVSQRVGVTAAVGTHHFVLTRNAGGSVTLYLDGAQDSGGNPGASNAFVFDRVWIGYPQSAGNQEDLTMSDVAVWESTVLSANQAATLGSAAFGFRGDSASGRISRLLDLLGVPSGLYSIGTASSSVGDFEGGTSALSYLVKCARSDQGRLFVSRDGKITFEPKTTDMGASSVATFADDSTASSVRYTGFELELDDRLVFNRIVTNGVDVSATVDDDTSQSAYSVRSLTVDTALPSADACRDIGGLYTARYADPSTRGRAWQVNPQIPLNGTSTLGWATVLGRELGNVVTLKRSPSTGTAITKTVQITSISHNVTPEQWTVSFAGAPAYTTASFRWGTSNWDGSDGWS